MDFKFKYVNEEQLMKVIKRVQRDRRCKKQNAEDFVQELSTEKYVTVPQEVGRPQNVEVLTNSQSVGGRTNREYFTFSRDKFHPLSMPVGYEAEDKRERVNTLVIRLRNTRRNILGILDELTHHNERIILDDNYFKDSNEVLNASADAKARNFMCLIIRQEYPIVVNMRRLGLSTFQKNILSHLQILLDCHNIALRMLKIFIRGIPYTLSMEKSKEKLRGLLERIITLSSVCKILSGGHSDIVRSKDFLMDDVDRKCVNLLESGKKRPRLDPISQGKNLKIPGQLCTHAGLNKITNDACCKYERHITRRTFKKLADRVFGGKERSRETNARRKSSSGAPEVKSSKDKVHSLKEESKTNSKQVIEDSPNKLELPVHDITRPQSCRDISLRETVTDLELRCEAEEEEINNLTGDKKTEDHEICEIFDAVQSNLPNGADDTYNQEEISLTKLQQHNEHSNGLVLSKQSTNSFFMNDEKQQETPSVEDLKCSDEIKLSNAAGSISDIIIGECLGRIGHEVDNFVADLVQNMFSLEFS
ncbi:uncharacterized protein [Hetaerina americana]|uniref:uncharacterized protein isoform X1 n=1 Tax=Hetaerina americana TaxID=62018 RepID=UPI003A7F4F00